MSAMFRLECGVLVNLDLIQQIEQKLDASGRRKVWFANGHTRTVRITDSDLKGMTPNPISGITSLTLSDSQPAKRKPGRPRKVIPASVSA